MMIPYEKNMIFFSKFSASFFTFPAVTPSSQNLLVKLL